MHVKKFMSFLRKPLLSEGTHLQSQPAYDMLMGELLHLVNGTKPDVTRRVSALNSYTKSRTVIH